MAELNNPTSLNIVKFQKLIPVFSWQIFFPVALSVALIFILQKELWSQIVNIFTQVENAWLLALFLVLIPFSVLIRRILSSQAFVTTAKQFLAAWAIVVYIAAGFLGQVEAFNLITNLKIPSWDFISVCISFIISIVLLFQAFEAYLTFVAKPELNGLLEAKLAQTTFSNKSFILLLLISIFLPIVGAIKFSAINNLNYCIFLLINLQNLFLNPYDRT